MPLYRIYIGSDNERSKVDIDSIITFFNKRYESFTIQNSHGYFKGNAEPSVIITLATADGETLVKELKELRKILNQDGIGIEIQGTYHRVTATDSVEFL